MSEAKSNQRKNDESKSYMLIVTVITFLLPAVCFLIEHFIKDVKLTFEFFIKWFVFFAVGFRLFLAGIRQTTKPAFTAKEIFHIESADSYVIIRELGFANLCAGLLGFVSLFKPEWRIVSAFSSGLYFGMAGILHLLKKPVGANERFALWTDLIIFALLAAYVFKTI